MPERRTPRPNSRYRLCKGEILPPVGRHGAVFRVPSPTYPPQARKRTLTRENRAFSSPFGPIPRRHRHLRSRENPRPVGRSRFLDLSDQRPGEIWPERRFLHSPDSMWGVTDKRQDSMCLTPWASVVTAGGGGCS